MPTTFPLGNTVFYVDTVDPSATSDLANIGARPGYWWHNSTDNSVHLCLTATSGAAVWQKQVPSTRTVTAGTGLTGGGSLSSNITLSLTGVALELHSNTTGTGTDGLDVVRATQLGGAAFLDPIPLGGIFTVSRTSNYQITPVDFRKLILATASTLTFTLPSASDLENGWCCFYKNRSGNTLVITRSGSDTINGGSTLVSINTATAIGAIIKTSNSTFEVT